ncbi:MAG TPA: hypothetical protein VM487_21115 [Phycisphaerae bacterium]|nr:hypothetical protein [Phycisphaerae bacterium]
MTPDEITIRLALDYDDEPDTACCRGVNPAAEVGSIWRFGQPTPPGICCDYDDWRGQSPDDAEDEIERCQPQEREPESWDEWDYLEGRNASS